MKRCSLIGGGRDHLVFIDSDDCYIIAWQPLPLSPDTAFIDKEMESSNEE